MEAELKGLRKLNRNAGLLHLASFIAIILLANDAKLPVNATYMTEAPGTGSFSSPVQLFNLNISYMVAAFLFLSAFFHFFITSPKIFPRYTDGLGKHINVYRWVEYSLSSSIMIIVILQLNGVTQISTLIAVFGVNVSMILFGWLQEKYTTPGNGDMLPFWFGCIAGIVPWVVVLFNLLHPKGPIDASAPAWVIGIVVSLFVLFNCFAIAQWKQYKAKGKWANYLHGERIYIVLSLVAKSLLAWQVFSGALAS